MCFVFIWEQTATCATYSINWSVFITEIKSVYCAVRTGSLNKAVCASYLKGQLIAQKRVTFRCLHSKSLKLDNHILHAAVSHWNLLYAPDIKNVQSWLQTTTQLMVRPPVTPFMLRRYMARYKLSVWLTIQLLRLLNSPIHLSGNYHVINATYHLYGDCSGSDIGKR